MDLEPVDEEKEMEEWRKGLREFNPSFKGLHFFKKTAPVSSDEVRTRERETH